MAYVMLLKVVFGMTAMFNDPVNAHTCPFNSDDDDQL
jgi:hypothetical protein